MNTAIRKLIHIIQDDEVRSKQLHFFDLTEQIEKTYKRHLTGHELRTLYGMTIEQMNLFTEWMKEGAANEPAAKA